MNVRTIFGALAWILSSNFHSRAVSNSVAISADEDSTTYLLSRNQRINVSSNDTENTMPIISKKGKEKNIDQKIIFASVSNRIFGVEMSNVYVYPNPVFNTLYINGVNEDYTDLIIYDLNGNFVLGEDGNEIDVTPLAKGTYILGIEDHYVRFIKS